MIVTNWKNYSLPSSASIPYSQRRKDDEREKRAILSIYLLSGDSHDKQVLPFLIEKEQSEGRVDCIIETPMFVYIFEFKRDGSATEALKQIEEKGYAREYATDNRNDLPDRLQFLV